MRFWLAVRAFVAILFDSRVAADVARLLDRPAPVESGAAATTSPREPPGPPARSDALTLLATLQREARFVDIVKEPLADYSNEQIGAAARDVLRDCGTALDRLFGIEPVVNMDEGAELETPADFDAGRYRLIGSPAGSGPYRGQLTHHGWQATRCDLPRWSGSQESAMVVAPVELEVRQ